MIHAIERAILLDVPCEVYVTSREMSYAVLGRTSCVVGHSEGHPVRRPMGRVETVQNNCSMRQTMGVSRG